MMQIDKEEEIFLRNLITTLKENNKSLEGITKAQSEKLAQQAAHLEELAYQLEEQEQEMELIRKNYDKIMENYADTANRLLEIERNQKILISALRQLNDSESDMTYDSPGMG